MLSSPTVSASASIASRSSPGAKPGHTRTRLISRYPTWDHLSDLVTVTLGGRAADMILGDGANTGAEDDLA